MKGLKRSKDTGRRNRVQGRGESMRKKTNIEEL